MQKILLISDTHNYLDERFVPHFKRADEIWHAGDIGSLKIIDQLKKYSKVKAVWGNIDNSKIRSELKKSLFFKCEEVKVMITHIGGYTGKYTDEVQKNIQKKKPDLFICGHSHILKIVYDKKNKLLHMNPGSIGDFGIHKVKTALSFYVEKKRIHNLNIIELPKKKLPNSIR